MFLVLLGHDLGLFSPVKLRTDLRNLLADQHTVEEEMEAAAVAAAAMVQWLAPISSPWRLHQRDMMRKIENLHRQVLRKAGGAAAIARAALAGGQAGGGFPFANPQGRYSGPRGFRGSNQQFLEAIDPAGDATPRLIIREVDEDGRPSDEIIDIESMAAGCGDKSTSVAKVESVAVDEILGEPETIDEPEQQHIAGASGDHPPVAAPQKPRQLLDNGGKPSVYPKGVDTNNTNSAVPCPRGDDVFSGTFETSNNSNNNNQGNTFSRGFEERPPRGGFRGGLFSNRNRNLGRPASRPFSQSICHITSPTAKFDLNCGFTDDEVEELLCQGIKPWDSEAAAALAVLHGEMDHLLN